MHRRPRDLDAAILALILAAPASGSGLPLTSTQAYRSLGRLVWADRVRRVESINAYIADADRDDIVLICERCASVTRSAALGTSDHLSAVGRSGGLASASPALELLGRFAAQDERY